MKTIIPPRTLRDIANDMEARINDCDQLAMIAIQQASDQVSIEVLMRALRMVSNELSELHGEMHAIVTATVKEVRS
jgi:hypothetical protein